MRFPQVFTLFRNALCLTSLPLTLVAIMPTAAQAAIFSRMYVFGDSLSDTGNLLDITQTFPPSSAGYFNGRVANGPIWLDTLAEKLELSLPPISRTAGGTSPTGVNFAVNSATTSDRNNIPIPLDGLVGLQQQITQFQQANTVADPEALYILWAGANDYLGGGVTDPTQPVTNLANAVTTLFETGARNFLVANLPPLGNAPLTLSQGTQVSNGLNQLTLGHNFLLSQSLGQLSNLPGINLKTLDVGEQYSKAINNPSAFGFTDVDSPCLVNSPLFYTPSPSNPISICSNPNEYVFWDDVHPTSAVHKIIAEEAFKTLTVPEPALVFAQLAFGAFAGVKVIRKRKQKTISH